MDEMERPEPELVYMKHRGGTVVWYSDNQYHKLRTFKNGSIMWRCSSYKKSKCLNTITIKDDHVINISNKPHKCQQTVGRLIIAKEIANLKSNVSQSDRPVTQLYEEAADKFDNKGLNFIASLPTFKSVQHSLYDMRNKSVGVSKTVHKCFEEIQVPSNVSKFILADYYFEGERILVFANPEIRQLIGAIKEFFGDATFKSCPRPFGELYSIHGDIGSTIDSTNVLPLVFALLPNKEQKTYSILYQLIKSQLPDWEPKIFHCDYEVAAINALSDMFPQTEIKGCFYHWSRAIWRKAKSLEENKTKGQKRIIALTAVLPLLPVTDMINGWKYISEESRDLDMNKTKYVERFWLKERFLLIVSVFGERHRTNNVLEGWHAKINKKINKNTNTLMRLLNVLWTFQIRKIKQYTKNHNMSATKRTKIAIKNDDYIMRVQMALINEEITVGNALEKLR